ncbi:hypothetical protein ACQ4WP_05530 [Janthinobacterium sp. GB4P2]|uniref:hypothetical protein n=1 Tax=Janthinobacterium sp. GB4P2 TaxID=3424189 RepID=UPI003F25413E
MHALPLSALASLPAPYRLRVQRNDDDGFAATLYSATRDDLRQVPADPAVIEQLITMQRSMQSQGAGSAVLRGAMAYPPCRQQKQHCRARTVPAAGLSPALGKRGAGTTGSHLTSGSAIAIRAPMTMTGAGSAAAACRARPISMKPAF